MNVSKLAITRPTLIVVIFTVLSLLGIFSYKQLNYELFPDFSMPNVMITTLYPGASPIDVENSLSKKMEDELASVEKLTKIKSFSQEGISLILLELKSNADIDKVIREVERKINAVRPNLPKDIIAPIVSKFSMGDFPIMNIAVTGDMPQSALYDLVKHQIKPSLTRLKGVGDITIAGGEEREIQVKVNPAELERKKISILQVLNVIQVSNLDFPTGKVKNANEQILIRLSGKFKTLDDLGNLIIAFDESNSPIKLKDVAEVIDSNKEIKSINRYNGMTSIGIMVKKQVDANTVEVSKHVRNELDRLTNQYQSEQLTFYFASDQAVYTLDAAKAVNHDLWMAIMLVAVVMLVFLHSLRNSFIVMVAIPASIVSTFIAMYLLGFSLNLMTLLGISLSIGILVDDSIVVIENIYRHLEMGKNRMQAALDGRMEIGFTAISITLVDVVVFLPVALVDNIISEVIRQFSLVIVVSTLISLFVSFTITPLLASRISKIEKYRKGSPLQRLIDWFEKTINRFGESIQGILFFSIRHKAITLLTITAMLIAAISMIPLGLIENEFIDMGDRGEIIIQMELPKSATIEETNAKAKQVEEYVRSKPEVKALLTRIGSTSDFTDIASGAYKAEINAQLIDKKERILNSALYAHKLRNELEGLIPGVKFITTIVSPIGGSDQVPIQVTLQCPNRDTLRKYSAVLYEKIRTVPGTKDVKISVGNPSPEIKVSLDKEKMAQYGLTTEMVGATMQVAYSGNQESRFSGDQYEYDINVRLNDFDCRNIDDVKNLSFVNMVGDIIKLKQFASIEYDQGPSRIERINRVPAITINSQLFGRALGNVGDDVKSVVSKTEIPSDINVIYEGDLQNQDDSFGSMGLALLASIIFVYLLMVALYQSYLYPFVVLFSIPLAVIGALLVMALAKQTLNVFTLLGMIMMIGLVAKNAILVVDFTNQLRSKGVSMLKALISATRLRLRPVLMTTLSMIIAMFPIALSASAGAEWKNGLAWVLIGGLSSSMFLSLVVVPIVYIIFNTAKERINHALLTFGKNVKTLHV